MTRLFYLTLIVALISSVPVHAQHEDPPLNVSNSLGMRFVWIAPGNFMMGNAKKERFDSPEDATQRRVTLAEGFYMGVHTVTQEQWQEIMGKNPSHFHGEKNLPVEMVSWDECQEFIKKLREKEKKPYRLPTEAEWEYACRAGTTTPFHFGETISTDQANYNGNQIYGKGQVGKYREKTMPVGSYPANTWGLHDMHGNVWQWCQDWFWEPKHEVDGNLLVLRGGSWIDGPSLCRSAYRHGAGPDATSASIGFRLCFCLGIAESKMITTAWFQEVAAMPADQQVEAVAAKLKELNPRFDGTVAPKIEKGVVTGLTFLSTAVSDISPLQALAGLRSLDCSNDNAKNKIDNRSPLTDLSPLKGMGLTSLDCSHTPLTDLSALKGMKLTSLNCCHTKIADLSPLLGMQLTSLDCSHTPVADLSPLKGMLVAHLNCGDTKVTDLSPLQDMPLTGLNCRKTQVSDLSPLKGMKLTGLECGETQVSDLSPLKGMKLASLWCGDTKVADLSPVTDMKLTTLNCAATQVSDLSSLKGMELTNLFCSDTKVADLSALKGMKLECLIFDRTKVADLSPLKGMKLSSLGCGGTRVVDLSTLKEMPLLELWCDFMFERDAGILRSINTLERINDKPAKEVLKRAVTR